MSKKLENDLAPLISVVSTDTSEGSDEPVNFLVVEPNPTDEAFLRRAFFAYWGQPEITAEQAMAILSDIANDFTASLPDLIIFGSGVAFEDAYRLMAGSTGYLKDIPVVLLTRDSDHEAFVKTHSGQDQAIIRHRVGASDVSRVVARVVDYWLITADAAPEKKRIALS